MYFILGAPPPRIKYITFPLPTPAGIYIIILLLFRWSHLPRDEVLGASRSRVTTAAKLLLSGGDVLSAAASSRGVTHRKGGRCSKLHLGSNRRNPEGFLLRGERLRLSPHPPPNRQGGLKASFPPLIVLAGFTFASSSSSSLTGCSPPRVPRGGGTGGSLFLVLALLPALGRRCSKLHLFSFVIVTHRCSPQGAASVASSSSLSRGEALPPHTPPNRRGLKPSPPLVVPGGFTFASSSSSSVLGSSPPWQSQGGGSESFLFLLLALLPPLGGRTQGASSLLKQDGAEAP